MRLSRRPVPLLALPLLLVAAACGGGDSPTEPPPPAPVATVTITPAAATLNVGATEQLTAATLSSAGAALTGRTVTWSSGTTSVATVSTTGLVTAVAAGTATITATSEGRTGTATITVQQNANPVASVAVTPATATIFVDRTQQLSATLRDAQNNVILNRTPTWSSSDTTIARVSVTGVVRGVAPGAATITASAEGQSATAAITVQLVPVALVRILPAGVSLQVGATRQFTATPLDAENNSISGRTIAWTARNTAVASVSGSGLVTAVGAGTTQLVATVDGRADSVSVVVTSGPPPVQAVQAAPATVSLLPGGSVPVRGITRDGFGNVLTGRTVTFASSNPAAATVSGAGVITAVAPGTTTITLTSEGVTATSAVTVQGGGAQFEIDIRNFGAPFTPEVQEAFDQARVYWQNAIVGDVADLTLGVRTTPACGAGSNTPTLSGEAIDDVIILARIDSIDGPGRVLGSAGPCLIRTGVGAPLTLVGIMNFDSADVRGLLSSGRFREVIRHEMAHVLGVGTLWTSVGCLQNPSNTTNGTILDTRFNCERAISAFDAVGGEFYTAGEKVPVENCARGVPSTCGAGTINGHWREITMDNELMTGYIENTGLTPNSVVTIASLADLGYVVNYGAAESYTLPPDDLSPAALQSGLRLSSPGGATIDLHDDIRRGPIELIDRFGRTVRIIRPGN